MIAIATIPASTDRQIAGSHRRGDSHQHHQRFRPRITRQLDRTNAVPAKCLHRHDHHHPGQNRHRDLRHHLAERCHQQEQHQAGDYR